MPAAMFKPAIPSLNYGMLNIEEIIRKAMEDGAFENLRGEGQPLALDTNPNADPEWELAFHILKENGFAPAFVEERQSIEKELAAARQVLSSAWRTRASSGAGWERALTDFQDSIATLNKRIRDYNLAAPHPQLARANIRIEQELWHIQHASQADAE